MALNNYMQQKERKQIGADEKGGWHKELQK
jgi:hypothetical protein